MAPDAYVIGAGPNGLAAGITLARAGLSVSVLEATRRPGGSVRSQAAEDGVIVDQYSAIYPLALASPFFRSLNIESELSWVTPTASFAHARGSNGVIAYRDLGRTLDELDRPSRKWWSGTFEPLKDIESQVTDIVLGPMLSRGVRRRSFLRFANAARRTTKFSAGSASTPDAAKALIAGSIAHSGATVGGIAAGAAGVFLAMHGHKRGWALPVGGAQTITDFLVAELSRLGGAIEYGRKVRDLHALERRSIVIAATSAAQVAAFAPEAMRGLAVPRLKPGVSVSRVDLVLSEPIPWLDGRMHEAGTIHLGGSWRELALANHDIQGGRHAGRPFILLAQPSVHDPTRTATGQHVVWAYVQVPFRSNRPQSGAVLDELERHAPGTRDLVGAIVDTPASRLSDQNPSLDGGDISGGATDLLRLLARPRLGPAPWRTADRRLYIGSSSATPGPGVHGMSGWWAAATALQDHFGITVEVGR